MKTDRFPSAAGRAAAVALAGLLLLATAHPAAGHLFRIRVCTKRAMAAALARYVGEAQKRFGEARRALRGALVPGGAYPRQKVAGLIARTEKDLDAAIARVGEPGLDALRAWSAEELRPILQEVEAPAGRAAALPLGLSAPRSVAVIASLGDVRLPPPASVRAAAPQPATITAERTAALLDQVGEVIGRIFLLAAYDDLEVRLWVGSTPEPRATFRFWPHGKLKGSTPETAIVRTNGKRNHVLRGLYSYRAAGSKGAVTIEYPVPADAPTVQLASERLDLVEGSRFFCCRFAERYCHHVETKNECRP